MLRVNSSKSCAMIYKNKKLDEEKARNSRNADRQSERQELIKRNRKSLERIQANLKKETLSV